MPIRVCIRVLATGVVYDGFPQLGQHVAGDHNAVAQNAEQPRFQRTIEESTVNEFDELIQDGCVFQQAASAAFSANVILTVR